MREIKFRIYDKQFKKWISLDYYSNLGAITIENDGTLTLTSAFRFTQSMMICPEAFDVMQFIGLYDRNNNEIYEGDILRNIYDEKENRYLVQQTDYGWKLKKIIGRTLKSVRLINGLEKIGNIYDNPNLLKEE